MLASKFWTSIFYFINKLIKNLASNFSILIYVENQTKLACLFLNSSCLFFFSSNSFFFSCCSCLIYSRMIHIRKVDSKTYFLPCGRNSLSSNLGTHLLANMDEFLERKKLRRASLSKVQNRKGSLKAV